jgi:pimeloyl-ACP methyl ester carboxylesterase
VLCEGQLPKPPTLEILSRIPAENERPTPLLFVHGMMHGAWCWEAHFLDYFAGHGFGAYAVNLRGHGKSDGRPKLRWVRIADFVEDLESAVQRLPNPPVLIGHSMGGFVIQKYLEDHAAPGAVLLSSSPPVGLIGRTLKIARRRPFVFAKVNVTFSLLPLIATSQLAREAFFSADFPDDQLRAYWALMQDESYMAFVDMVALDLPKAAKIRTPLLVLGVARDNMLARAEIEATARAYHTDFDIIPNVAHDSMLPTAHHRSGSLVGRKPRRPRLLCLTNPAVTVHTARVKRDRCRIVGALCSRESRSIASADENVLVTAAPFHGPRVSSSTRRRNHLRCGREESGRYFRLQRRRSGVVAVGFKRFGSRSTKAAM